MDTITNQQLIDLYSGNSHGRTIATQAINKGIAFIDKYLATREQLCYVGSFRKKITLGLDENKKVHTKEDREGLYEEAEAQQRFMNLFMCVKYKNSGKLSSHNWFFNGFCK